MISDILINFFGLILFLFIFWKRLKEDYPSSSIFTPAFYMLSGIASGFFTASSFFPAYWFWLEVLGLGLGLTIGILKFRLRVFETIEASIISLLPWLSLIFIKDAVSTSSLTSFLAFFAGLCLIVFFFFLDSHYKNFSWYRSGRVGFSGLTTLGTFFLLRSLFASLFPFVISFIGQVEVLVSGVLAFASFLAVYNLARKV